MTTAETPSGPDLRKDGVPVADLAEGAMARGSLDGEPVVLVRRGETIHAFGGKCTHYGGPLADGLFDGELVRCPWHHACFRPETGEAVHAPAFDPVSTYAVEERGGRLFVTGPAKPAPRAAPIPAKPSSVVILGGGA